MKRLRIIINPIAGHGLAPRIADYVGQSGLQDYYQVDIVTTEYGGHGAILAKEAIEQGFDVIVAAGGDGTVNEVASAVCGSAATLGIVPAGSGNGLARHIGMSTKPLTALKQLAQAAAHPIDTLRINGRFAVNVSGLGFDGYVAWLFNKSGKRGLSNYTRIGMQEYFRYPVAAFDIVADGKKIQKEGHMIVIANASQFGNAAYIAPRADLHDGKLDLVMVYRPPVIHVPAMFYRLFTGKLRDNKFIQTIHCKQFTATCSRPLHLHIDGEAVDPVSRIDVEVLPGSLNILMPNDRK